MKYFIDTEFIEDGITIDLISIGIFSEDGRSFYMISNDFNLKKAWDNKWIKENVLLPIYKENVLLPIHKENITGERRTVDQFTYETIVRYYNYWAYPNFYIKDRILEFIGWRDTGYVSYDTYSEKMIKNKSPEHLYPEFWGWYASYDWVVLCQLFGSMIDLPRRFPMYINDIKQLQHIHGIGDHELPEQENRHNALADATWNKTAYEYVMKKIK